MIVNFKWEEVTNGEYYNWHGLLRRIDGAKGFSLTCPLITKSDRSKFGKSEGMNIWLDKTKTSSFKFYQYWLNTSDEDAKNYIKFLLFRKKKNYKSY